MSSQNQGATDCTPGERGSLPPTLAAVLGTTKLLLEEFTVGLRVGVIPTVAVGVVPGVAVGVIPGVGVGEGCCVGLGKGVGVIATVGFGGGGVELTAVG